MKFSIFNFQLLLAALSTLVSGLSTAVSAADPVLAWDPSPSPNIAGYKLYYGVASRAYTASTNLPASPMTFALTNLPFGVLYFAMTALGVNGLESANFSNEVKWTNRFLNITLRLARTTNDAIAIEGSEDLRNWSRLAVIPKGSPPVILAAQTRRQMFRTAQGPTAPPPLPRGFAAPRDASPAPRRSQSSFKQPAPASHTEARERAKRRK